MLNVLETSWRRLLLQREFTIRVDVDGKEETVVLPLGEPTKGVITNALIRLRYSQDEMEAVVNNYLLEPTDESAKAEFDAMQAYRIRCKQCAEKLMSEL